MVIRRWIVQRSGDHLDGSIMIVCSTITAALVIKRKMERERGGEWTIEPVKMVTEVDEVEM